MDLNPEAGEKFMDPPDNNEGWGWSELFTSPGYTLVAGMLCGILANLLSKHIAPVARIPRDLATRVVNGPAKMVLVVRTDLGMTKGKAAAQCAHAAVMCYKKALAEQPKVLSSWETLGQTKVCLRVGGEDELLHLAGLAKDAGLVTGVVRDAGRTQVEVGSFTVLGIGPAPVAQVSKQSLDIIGILPLIAFLLPGGSDHWPLEALLTLGRFCQPVCPNPLLEQSQLKCL